MHATENDSPNQVADIEERYSATKLKIPISIYVWLALTVPIAAALSMVLKEHPHALNVSVPHKESSAEPPTSQTVSSINSVADADSGADAATADLAELDAARSKVTVDQRGITLTHDLGMSRVTGSINNYSKHVVTYWNVTVNYYDAANRIIDSQFTSDDQELLPGKQKRFEVYHNEPKATKRVDAKVTDVSFKEEQ